jgi:hypothetical protein
MEHLSNVNTKLGFKEVQFRQDSQLAIVQPQNKKQMTQNKDMLCKQHPFIIVLSSWLQTTLIH